MKKIFYIIAFISLTLISYGQTFSWVRNSFGPNSQPKMTSVCADKNGSAIIAGTYGGGSISFGTYTLSNSGGLSIFLTKYDSNGNVLWTKTHNGTNLCTSITSDALNNIIITGSYLSSQVVFDTYTLTNTGASNVFVVKYDPNGNVIWANSSTGANDNRSQDVEVDSNDNIYITGFYTSATVNFGSLTLNNPLSVGIPIAYIAKYDANGNILWAKNSSGQSQGNSISTSLSGDVFLTGHFNQPSIAFGTYTLTTPPSTINNMFLVKYNSSGNPQWARCATGPSLNCVSNAVCVDGNANAIITGYYVGDTVKFGAITLNDVLNNFEAEVFVTKYDSNGTEIWAKSGGENGDDMGWSIATFNNEYIVGGTFDALPLAFDSYTINPPPGSVDPTFIAKFDQNGNISCAYAFHTDAEDDKNDVSIDDEGNIYFTSRFFDTTLTVGTNTINVIGWPNIFLTKYNCSFVGLKENQLNLPISVYPNPNNGYFKLQIDKEIKKGEIILINLLGQKVRQQIIFKGQNNVITQNLSKGIYNYIILEDNSQISSGKIVLE